MASTIHEISTLEQSIKFEKNVLEDMIKTRASSYAIDYQSDYIDQLKTRLQKLQEQKDNE